MFIFPLTYAGSLGNYSRLDLKKIIKTRKSDSLEAKCGKHKGWLKSLDFSIVS